MLYRLVTLSSLVLFGGTVASAQVVKCRDAQGILHYAGSVDQLPESCRAHVETPTNLPPVTATDNGNVVSARCNEELRAADAWAAREWQLHGKRPNLGDFVSEGCYNDIMKNQERREETGESTKWNRPTWKRK